jgi:hypothetical protein
MGVIKMQSFHLAYAAKKNLDSGSAPLERMSKQIFMSSLPQEPRNGVTPLPRMFGVTPDLHRDQHMGRVTEAIATKLAG